MRKYLLGISTFALAFAILAISLLESSSVSFVLASQSPLSTPLPTPKIPLIDYPLPLPGGIHPDNPLWAFKATSDRIGFIITSNHLERAEKALFFADQRLVLSVALIQKQKPGTALVTLSKSEKYLEVASNHERAAREEGVDTTAFLKKLANSSLAHRQTIEEKILPHVSEEGRPIVVKTEDYSKRTFISASGLLIARGEEGPKNPFDSH